MRATQGETPASGSQISPKRPKQPEATSKTCRHLGAPRSYSSTAPLCCCRERPAASTIASTIETATPFPRPKYAVLSVPSTYQQNKTIYVYGGGGMYTTRVHVRRERCWVSAFFPRRTFVHARGNLVPFSPFQSKLRPISQKLLEIIQQPPPPPRVCSARFS